MKMHDDVEGHRIAVNVNEPIEDDEDDDEVEGHGIQLNANEAVEEDDERG